MADGNMLLFENLPTDQSNTIVLAKLEVEFKTPEGKLLRNERYELEIEGGETRRGTLDAAGKMHEINLPSGSSCTVRIPSCGLVVRKET